MNNKYTVVFCLIFLHTSLFGQAVLKTMKRLPDTGVKNSYTTTPGEDNDFNINVPFFINHGNGTTTDTVTGLMWQIGDGGEMTVENAAIYCDTLTLGGYNDWRLPNVYEAYSILNHQNNNPAMDVTVFAKTGAEYWWTSQKQANDATKVWCTNTGGGAGNHPKTETISAGGTKKFHVRAVRDIAVPISIEHFSIASTATVIDNLTGLMWQRQFIKDTLTWESALTYADTATDAGYTDWRLPNVKELQSIADVSRLNPCLNSNYFTANPAMKCWSSTTLPNKTGSAWYLDTRFGITTYDVKTRRNYVYLVRTADVSVAYVKQLKYGFQGKVYPNPFSNCFSVEGLGENSNCKLYNNSGVLLHSFTSGEQVSLPMLPAGCYYLKAEGRAGALRVIKQQ